MKNPQNHENDDLKLHIVFPKSSEDHRLQIVQINGAIFAVVHSPLESMGPINLSCEDWSLVLLAPIKSQTNILISGVNIICLNEIASEKGHVNVHASRHLVKLAHLIKPGEKVCQMGERGEFEYYDDPGAFLFHYRLFSDMMNRVRNGTRESFSDAQHKFMTSLCTLADKMEGKPENLDLCNVLDTWGIPYSGGK